MRHTVRHPHYVHIVPVLYFDVICPPGPATGFHVVDVLLRPPQKFGAQIKTADLHSSSITVGVPIRCECVELLLKNRVSNISNNVGSVK